MAERPAGTQPAQAVAGDELKTAIDQRATKIEQLGNKTFRSTETLLNLQELQELLKEFDRM